MLNTLSELLANIFKFSSNKKIYVIEILKLFDWVMLRKLLLKMQSVVTCTRMNILNKATTLKL